jgi:hypothetical protein
MMPGRKGVFLISSLFRFQEEKEERKNGGVVDIYFLLLLATLVLVLVDADAADAEGARAKCDVTEIVEPEESAKTGFGLLIGPAMLAKLEAAAAPIALPE